MATRVQIHPAALARVARDVGLLGPELSLAARKIATSARASDPPGGRRTRAFDARMRITPPAVQSGRAVVYVGTSWQLAHLWEFGSLNIPALRPLTRAAQNSGLRFEEGDTP